MVPLRHLVPPVLFQLVQLYHTALGVATPLGKHDIDFHRVFPVIVELIFTMWGGPHLI